MNFFITAGQVSDYTGAAALLDDLPKSSNAKLLAKAPPEQVVKDIRRQTRCHFSAEDKIHILL